MPDVLGAIKAVEQNDVSRIRTCNRHGEPVYRNRQGLSECYITQANND